ncbi:hypothetical protein [Litorisediminicola beolgyonensis]
MSPFRSFSLVCLVATAPLVAAAPVLAQDKAAECALQAEMVMAVVAERTGGASAGDAVGTVQAGLEGDVAKYASVVPAVADWVYSLPEKQLGDSVGTSWTEACMAR